MRRLIITALVTALVGGVGSAMFNLGPMASDLLLAGTIALTLPVALGVTVSDMRVRIRRSQR